MTLRALYYACHNWGYNRTSIKLISDETGAETFYDNWLILPEEYKSQRVTSFYYNAETDNIIIYYTEMIMTDLVNFLATGLLDANTTIDPIMREAKLAMYNSILSAPTDVEEEYFNDYQEEEFYDNYSDFRKPNRKNKRRASQKRKR